MGKNTRKTKEESKKATEIVQQLSAVSKTSNKRRARAVTNKKHKDAREEEKEDMEEKQHLSLAVNDDTTAILPTLVATEPSLTSSGLFQPSDGAADSSFCTKGQEWTPEEDEEVIAKLRIIRSGELSTKNMTVREAEQIQNTLPHRTVNAIKFRWNDKLKKKFVESNSSVDLQVSF